MTAHSATTTYLPPVEVDGFIKGAKIRVHVFGEDGSDMLPIQPGDKQPHHTSVRRAITSRMGKAPQYLTEQRRHGRGYIFTFTV